MEPGRKDLAMVELYDPRSGKARCATAPGKAPTISYTRKLLDRGVDHCAKKLGEEAVEAAIAAVAEDREGLVREAADVLYHLLVVLHVRGAFRSMKSRPNSPRALAKIGP